ncbi:MAG: tetratricopeptide repeat protein [Betaproteobacteria bacterium]|nr:tetratricopeptide repeat protein [Betaproteobacteria bacterium]
MSLINDMLRNIESKRPDDLARHSLQREIRSLPPEKRGAGRAIRITLSLGVLVALGLAAWHFRMYESELPLIPSPPPPVPALAVPPLLAVPSELAPVPPATTTQFDESLRMSSNLAVVPLPAAPVLGVPDPVPPQVGVVAPKNEPSLAVNQASTPLTAPSGPVKIEKSPVAATPRDRADAEFRKAESALVSGRSGEALDSMRAALKIDPSYVLVRQALLRQLLDMRRMDEAMMVLQEGVDLLPAQTGWAMSLARLQLEHGDLVAADRTLTHSQSYAEGNADYAGFQGHVKSRIGAHKQAVAHYQRAVRLAPNEGRWWLGLGLAQEADGRLPEARDALRRALAAGSLNADLSALAEQHLRQ